MDDVGRKRILAFGLVCRDYMVTTLGFPKENEKIRCTSCKPSYGGNCFNAIVNLQKLSKNSVECVMISVLGNDMIQKECVACLQKYEVDTKYMEVVEGENSPFSFIIVNEKTGSRTCILTPMNYIHVPRDYECIFERHCFQFCFFDHRYASLFRSSVLPHIKKQQIPLIFNYERRREPEIKFEKLILENTKILIGNGRLPNIFIDDEEEDQLNRMEKYLSHFPSIDIIILTQGEKGLLCMKKYDEGEKEKRFQEIQTVQEIFEYSSKKKEVFNFSFKRSSGVVKYVPVFADVKVVDTTGAGDAVSAGVLFSLLNGFDLDDLLLFSCYCGSRNCEDYGTTNLNCEIYSDFCKI